MKDYILLMYNDALEPTIENDSGRWGRYIGELQASGQFDGGSAVGHGLACRKGREDQLAPPALSGYIRLRAESLDDARRFLAGNPTYEAGGTVEVRELPRT